MGIKSEIKKVLTKYRNKRNFATYFDRYEKYAFREDRLKDEKQYEAVITKAYHGIEKGLSYLDYRPGFGKDAVANLVSMMEAYAKKYDVEAFFYKTALDVLQQYIKKNAEHGFEDDNLNERVCALKGSPNKCGGIVSFIPPDEQEMRSADYQTFAKNRHSIRHFSKEPVALDKIKKALDLAQLTPSACNRQGWRTKIITDKQMVSEVLKNQNGNRGFGEEIDKLLLVTVDLNYFNYSREMFQAYIDGGMYAMSLINSLHYERIGTIPLSASLTTRQEQNVRKILGLDEAEVLILFIGLGVYPEECQAARSQRHAAVYEII